MLLINSNPKIPVSNDLTCTEEGKLVRLFSSIGQKPTPWQEVAILLRCKDAPARSYIRRLKQTGMATEKDGKVTILTDQWKLATDKDMKYIFSKVFS
jgi:hypothetical protein